ncbi:filamentous hemagglutinin N-terminal domain-containing protein [Alkalisalibacterium limincola]|nr:filamentous hemagglutinin N-terminal domain-containing protein [Alkalisalibacterium limincola]
MNNSIASSPTRFAVSTLSAALLLALATPALAQSTAPTGGQVAAGEAGIVHSGNQTTITQGSDLAIINWQSFSIGADQTVVFQQPGASSIALNRVVGADPSVIMGTLTSNGQVFLVNPNGVLFGNGASVSVGGLVATTMNLGDADFLAGNLRFTDAGSGDVVNEGSLQANNGGYVALMGRNVRNDGVILAQLGSVALVGGEAVTIDVAGDGLLNVSVTQGAVNALVENGGLIQADGGRVLLTAQAAGTLLNTVVNNTGVIQAQTLENREGTIRLLADVATGTVNAGGVLDASAPTAGAGGFIETSAANVNIGAGLLVSTAAANGSTGTWRIGSQDFTIGSADGDNIAGTTLSAQLVTNNITIDTTGSGTGSGSIFVNDAVSWTASGAPTTLSLVADGNVEINAAITATHGNLSVCCGQDINVNAAITTTNGSVLLAAGRDVNQFADITVTDGNLAMCAANDVNIDGAITVTRGTDDPTRSLGLSRGLTLRADTDGTGPGVEGGTVRFAPLAPQATVTAAPVAIFYNPESYTAPTDYSTHFTLTEGAALSSYMLVFARAVGREADGTTTAILDGLKGDPNGVSLVAGPNAVANYASAEAGTHGITYSGYTLGGADAGLYALAENCCGPVTAHTTGTIAAAAPTPPPPPLLPAPIVSPVLAPATLVAVSQPPPPATMLTVVPAEEEVHEVPEAPPYAAPVRAPKPYRN